MADSGAGASASGDEPTERERELLREIAALRARVSELEARVPPSAGSPTPPPPPALPAHSPQSMQPSSKPPAADAVVLPSQGAVSGASLGGTLSVEQFIGRRVVPLVGAVAVLAAIGFLVHYAIEIGLIGRLSPAVRFALGVGTGLALLGAGEVVRRKGAPGAATGLDAAGVGSVMVSVALGVFSLGLFGGTTAVWIAAAAGVLACAWSVRSGSVVVAIVALIGVYAMPAGVGLLREEPRKAGIMLALALAMGLVTHFMGGARFAAARYVAVCAAVVLGIPVVAVVENAHGLDEAAAFVLAWWFMTVGSCTLAAQRGVDARGNMVNAVVASLALVAVPVGFWPGGELVPVVAGAAMLAGALLLRPMAVVPADDEERAALGQSGVAIGEACGILARTFAALALALGLGGLVFVVGDGLRAIVLVATAAVGTWAGRRYALLSFELVGLAFAALAAVIGGFLAIEGVVTRTTIAPPLGALAPFELVWSAETLALGAAALALMALTSLARSAAVAALLVPIAMLGWIVFSVRTVPSVLGCLLLVLPALVVPWIARARLATVAVAGALCAVASLWWVARTVDAAWGPGGGGVPELVAVVVPWIAAVVLLAHHAALGRARTVAVRVAVVAAGAAVAFVAAVVGSQTGVSGIDVGASIALGLAAAAVCAIVIGRVLRVPAVLDAGMLLAVAMLGVAALLGFVRVFERDGAEHAPLLGLGAIVACAVATALGLALAQREAGRPRASSWTVSGLGAVAAFAIAPLCALLVGCIVRGPLPAAVAVGSLMLVGVAELVVGFRRGVTALRWAGLCCFGLVVLRLYAVDLADAPMLVRIGLLFASGMVLVGTGIAYARLAGRKA